MLKYLLFFSLLFAACGSDDSDSKSDDSLAAFQGVWVSDCVKVNEDTFISGSTLIEGDQKTSTVKYFFGNECLQATIESITVSTFKVVGTLDIIDGAKKVNSAITSLTTAYMGANQIAYVNQNKHYGYDDWKEGEHKDTAGKVEREGDEPDEAVGTITYNIAKIDLTTEPPTFLAGDTAGTKDGSTEEKRPTTLAEERFILKKQ